MLPAVWMSCTSTCPISPYYRGPAYQCVCESVSIAYLTC